ncbi:Mu transposase domain-containing protein [Nocardia aurantia]|uniref:Mu transposase domain-containing protein n=1 Tax=Nocardia aurantia TaxID=2585199 RepID=UPI001885C3F3|nr:hypothetical protein [Nocardia aurantia]
MRTNKYSVPIRFIGRQVRALLHASELVVYDGSTEIARHDCWPRPDPASNSITTRKGCSANQGPAEATALEQARAAEKFTPIHEKPGWAAVRFTPNGGQWFKQLLLRLSGTVRSVSD